MSRSTACRIISTINASVRWGNRASLSPCRGAERDYERALWLALADPNEHDRPDDRKEKQLLRDRWGDWPGLKADMPARQPAEHRDVSGRSPD